MSAPMSHKDFIEFARSYGIRIEKITRTRVIIDDTKKDKLQDASLDWTYRLNPNNHYSQLRFDRYGSTTIGEALRSNRMVAAVLILRSRVDCDLREAKKKCDELTAVL